VVGVVPNMARDRFWKLGHLDGDRCLSDADMPWMRAQGGACAQVAPDDVAGQLDPGSAAAAYAPQDEFLGGYSGGAERLLEAGSDLDPRRSGQECPTVHRYSRSGVTSRHKMLPGSREAKAMVPAEPFAV